MAMRIINARGTRLFAAPSAPGSWRQYFDGTLGDQDAQLAAFDAMPWVEVGNLAELGEFGADSQIGRFATLADGVACKYRGTTDSGGIAFTLARAQHVGHDVLHHAERDRHPVSLKIELSARGHDDPAHSQPARAARYCMSGYVARLKTAIGSGNDIVRVLAAVALSGRIVEGPATDSTA